MLNSPHLTPSYVSYGHRDALDRGRTDSRDTEAIVATWIPASAGMTMQETMSKGLEGVRPSTEKGSASAAGDRCEVRACTPHAGAAGSRSSLGADLQNAPVLK